MLDLTEFKMKLEDIAKEHRCDIEKRHFCMDVLLVETLEHLGYDLTIYNDSERYHA